MKGKGCLGSPIPSVWSYNTSEEEKASLCHQLLHKVCSSMTGQELWPSCLLEACTGTRPPVPSTKLA